MGLIVGLLVAIFYPIIWIACVIIEIIMFILSPIIALICMLFGIDRD